MNQLTNAKLVQPLHPAPKFHTHTTISAVVEAVFKNQQDAARKAEIADVAKKAALQAKKLAAQAKKIAAQAKRDATQAKKDAAQAKKAAPQNPPTSQLMTQPPAPVPTSSSFNPPPIVLSRPYTPVIPTGHWQAHGVTYAGTPMPMQPQRAPAAAPFNNYGPPQQATLGPDPGSSYGEASTYPSAMLTVANNVRWDPPPPPMPQHPAYAINPNHINPPHTHNTHANAWAYPYSTPNIAPPQMEHGAPWQPYWTMPPPPQWDGYGN